MAEPLGLRERKKQAMRHRIAATALQLFADRGFEVVTVAEVAAAAGISEKTVFNYFPTKEALVTDHRLALETELLRRIRERQPGESVLTAVRRHTLWLAERLADLPAEKRAAFRRMVQQSPALLARFRQISVDAEAELAALLAAETGPAGAALAGVVAGIIGVVVRQALDVQAWTQGSQRPYAEIVAGIEAACDLLGRGLADYGVRRAP